MRGRRVGVLAVIAMVSVMAAARAEHGSVSIEVLSNRADLISGGDALVALQGPDGVDLSTARVDVDGRDVTGAFSPRADGRYVGLVTGLADGENLLTARLPDSTGARIAITNHPASGPVFAGPQVQPWYCAEGALDAQCSRPTTYEFLYRRTLDNSFQPYDPSSPPPAQLVATTTTDQGQMVPYIVRVETGNQDRDQYKIAVLYAPGAESATAWNHKLVITHGGGCGTGHGEGAAPDLMNDTALSRGFATMSTALDNNGHNCNIAVQAESLMMAKEHLIEAYGEIRYTIGTGCSGGSLTQNWVANAYPGIYDGIMPECSYPDTWSSAVDVDDCVLLSKYWDDPRQWAAGVVWNERQMAAAGGHFSNSVCHAWTKIFPFYQTFRPQRPSPTEHPLDLQGCGVPNDQVYDRERNPHGVRCSLADYMVAIFGTRPQDGFANRPLDNVGVQYGLRALLAGQITPAEFADLNAKIGSNDIDYVWQPARGEADIEGLRNAYRSGSINEMNNLDRVAIIDRPLDNVEIHEEYRSWAARARLDASTGGHDNHVIWYGEGAGVPDALLTMDEWLAGVEADHSDRTLPEKIVANRPAAARDRCTMGIENLPDENTCQSLMGPWMGTRAAAGGPFAGDVNKCSLSPLVRSDYFPVQFTDTQWAQLEDTFPHGVCDWTARGVEQQPTIEWLTYADGPGGRALGEPPAAVQFS
jgi:hypothetical protein